MTLAATEFIMKGLAALAESWNGLSTAVRTGVLVVSLIGLCMPRKNFIPVAPVVQRVGAGKHKGKTSIGEGSGPGVIDEASRVD